MDPFDKGFVESPHGRQIGSGSISRAVNRIERSCVRFESTPGSTDGAIGLGSVGYIATYPGGDPPFALVVIGVVCINGWLIALAFVR